MAHGHRRVGWVLAETIVVLALVGIVLALGLWWSHRGPSAATVAQELVRVVVAARWTAVHEGVPRSLVAGASHGTSAGASTGASHGAIHAVAGGFTCDAGAAGARVVWSWPPRTTVGWPPMGLAFAPDGRPRRCDGSGVGNTTVLIEGPRGDRAAVIVASLGRVRWERR